MVAYFGLNGQRYDLENTPIGAGGEASIYRVSGGSNLVAKIYKTDKATKEHEDKIKVMISSSPDNRNGELAWPVDVLYSSNHHFAGFVMPLVHQKTNLRECYIIENRGGKPWSFFIRIARNLAAVVYNVHEKGHFIGDLNPENILVNESDRTVTVVDTDSFHIRDVENSSRIFRCLVAKPEFVAPELVGVNFATAPIGKSFNQYTDRHSLAILIFCLLFNGAHPFTCTIPNGVEGGLYQQDENIKNGICPYFPETIPYGVNLGIPKYSITIDWLPQEIKSLFHRAFVEGIKNPARRPAPEEWYESLKKLEKGLKRCSQNSNHLYPSNNTQCPWCAQNVRRGSVNNNSRKQSTPVLNIHKKPLNPNDRTYVYWSNFLLNYGISPNSVKNSRVSVSSQSGINKSSHGSSSTNTVVKFKVRYILDNKQIIYEEEYSPGDLVIIKPPYKKSGYDITGWTDYGKLATNFFMPARAVALKATSTPLYSLTYKVDGNVIGAIEHYKPGELVTVRSPFKKEGYGESPWEEGNSVLTSFRMPNHNVVLTASPKPNKHTVHYQVNGKSVASEVHDFNDLVAVRPQYKLKDHRVTPWICNGRPAVNFTMPDEDVVITASATSEIFTVSYEVDGKVVYQPITYRIGDVVKIRSQYQIEGYTASPWMRDNNVALNFRMPDHDIVLSATLTVNEHNVIYKLNGDQVGDIETYKYGDFVTIRPPLIQLPKKYEWTIEGKTAKDFHMPDHDVEVCIKTNTKIHTVTYQINGKVVGDVEYHIVSDPVKIRDQYQKEGYTVGPWKREWFDAIDFLMPDSNVVITAKADPHIHTVTYMVNGKPFGEPEFWEFETEVELLQLPKKQGYSRTKWMKNGEEISQILMPDEDIVLSAEYKPKQYEITYLLDNEVFGDKETIVYNELIVPRPLPEKRGYTFSEWQYLGKPVTDLRMPDKNIVLKSKTLSQPPEYTVTYLVNRNQIVCKESHRQYDTVKLIPKYNDGGYSGSDWKLGKSIAEDFEMPGEDVVLTAKLTPNKYTVTYKVDNVQIGESETYSYKERVKLRKRYNKIDKGSGVSNWKFDGESNNADNFEMPAKDVILTAYTYHLTAKQLKAKTLMGRINRISTKKMKAAAIIGVLIIIACIIYLVVKRFI